MKRNEDPIERNERRERIAILIAYLVIFIAVVCIATIPFLLWRTFT